jgi:hypothetical protein
VTESSKEGCGSRRPLSPLMMVRSKEDHISMDDRELHKSEMGSGVLVFFGIEA